jgi:N-acetylglutamate synthase-like GNAT family acetyltransferase
VDVSIRQATESDYDWITEVVRGWGDDFIVSRGRKRYPARLDGLIAVDEKGENVGLATYEIIEDQCELVTLDAFRKFKGIGTRLLQAVAGVARERGCRRLWLITTNDNLDAIRFYQRRNMSIATVHTGALNASRKLKPSIPMVGMHGIPLRDEIEFEMTL